MDVVDEFVVKLGLDPRDYQREIKGYRDDRKRLAQDDQKYNKEQDDAQRRAVQGFRQMRNEAIGFVTILAGANTVGQFANNLLQGDAATGRFAANLGLATERVGAWEEAIKRAGGAAQEGRALIGLMASAYQSLQLTGTTGNDADLKGLGVTAQDLQTPEQALLRIAEASQSIPRAEFTARLQRLGVSDAGITLLSKGRRELELLLGQMEKQGVATKESAEDAIAFDTALNDIEQTIKGKARPAITELAGALAEAATDQEALNVVSNIAIGVLGAVALAVAAATWPWLALAGAIAGAVTAYQSWTNRGDQSTGEWAAGKLRAGRAWIDEQLGITSAGGGEGRIGWYNRGRDAMGNPTGGAAGGAGGVGSSGDIEAFFKSRGYSPAQAQGIAAGIHAESGGSHTARNPTSGAYGLGQHLSKDRRDNFRKRYGHDITRSTRAEQLDFIDWELKGGDAGGAAVRAQTTAAGTLGAYVNKFMRPAKGAETTGDIRRGMAYINGRGGSASASAGAVTNSTTIGTVIVNTQATDANGIARDLPGALSKRSVVTQANSGLSG